MYKISNYNHFQAWQNGSLIAFNAKSGAVALMTRENFELYNNLALRMKSDDLNVLNDEEKTLLDQLKYGKFVIADDSDEIDGLEFVHNLHRYDQTSYGLTIAPTMNCNMGCEYCFEDNKKGKMSPEVIDAIVKAVDDRADSMKSLDVNWYGGEPLLALDTIEELTNRFREIADGKKFKYSASMISNGYLLTEKVAKKLRDLGIYLVQVTLDGPQRIHDRRRPLKNGKGSYGKILNNIKDASDYVGIGIRVNVDKDFTEDIIVEMLEELKAEGLREKVGVYFGQLEPASEICANIAENCYNANEFSQAEVKYYRLLLNHGFLVHKAPTPISVYCMAQSVGALLIDPDGDMYRCYNHAGNKEKSVGNITDEINYQHPIFRDFFRFDPFREESCRSCEVLPLCMGGCPARRVDRKLQGEELCDTWKHNLSSMLDIIAVARQQEKQKAAAAAKETK